MKKSIIYVLMLAGIVCSSCSTYQYTSRHVDVLRRSIRTSDQMAGIDVNFDKHVTATSDYQLTRKDAIEQAEFMCIENSKIDVVVDPIVKVEYNPFKAKMRYKATIVGFSGTYKPAPTVLDKSKEYTLEDIEKYKLLTDPNFPQYYYNSAEGDNYYFGTGGVSQEKKSSLIVKDVVKQAAKRQRAPKSFDYNKSKQLRDAGIGLTVGGVVTCIGIGVGCFIGGQNARVWHSTGGYNDYDYYTGTTTWRNTGYYGQNDKAVASGIAFMTIGGAAAVSGIIMAAVGGSRMKKVRNTDISFNAGANGIGVGLTF